MPQPDYASLDLHAKVDELVAPYIDADENVGVVVGILRGAERVTFGYGRLAKDRDGVPNERTLFEIGSITKVFTALLFADMCDRKEVQRDDPIRKYLPETVTVPRFHDREITLYHLATHTSALPRLPDNLDATVKDEANPYAEYTVQHLYDYLNQCKLHRAPGAKADYSNLGMGLLGHILTLVGGKSYEDLVLERVCRPLGLNDTAIALTEEQKCRLARGHAGEAEPVSYWDMPTLAGAGALRSSVAEMLRFLQANLTPATPLHAPIEQTHVIDPLPRGRWWLSYAWALTIAVVCLALQAVWQRDPEGYAFMLLFYAPVILAAWFAGGWPGVVAGAVSLGASRYIWGEKVNWSWPALIIPVLAWFFSLRHWGTAHEVLLGWQIDRLSGDVPLLWHNGGTGGFRSYCGFIKESATAVVVLSNSANDADDIGRSLLEYLHESNVVWAKVERTWRTG
jgi:CubicO group peptidase (beta-lactamase class C family)